MRKYLLALLLTTSPALAHDENPECPICTCTLIQRDPLWRDLHDAWWSTYHQIQKQIVDYSRCVGTLNELERVLGRPLTKPNQVILDYEQNITHPLENLPNDNLFAGFELEAAGVTLGQFFGEALACSAGVDALRIEASRRIKLKKR